jgi:hypothetical protein
MDRMPEQPSAQPTIFFSLDDATPFTRDRQEGMDAIDAQRSACVQAAIQDALRTRPDPREASIKLPAACPFAKRLPKGRDHITEAIKAGAIPCCRIQRPYWLDNTEPPLCRIEGEEVYRFLYMHAFGAHPSIRIAKRRDEITVERRYYARMFNEPEFFAALLTEADWMCLQNALTAADFWALPPVVRSQGMWLDGYDVIVE